MYYEESEQFFKVFLSTLDAICMMTQQKGFFPPVQTIITGSHISASNVLCYLEALCLCGLGRNEAERQTFQLKGLSNRGNIIGLRRIVIDDTLWTYTTHH